MPEVGIHTIAVERNNRIYFVSGHFTFLVPTCRGVFGLRNDIKLTFVGRTYLELWPQKRNPFAANAYVYGRKVTESVYGLRLLRIAILLPAYFHLLYVITNLYQQSRTAAATIYS